jgi:mRNA-degrading endonuclease RelE of RelBE toxin-antitoxin system
LRVEGVKPRKALPRWLYALNSLARRSGAETAQPKNLNQDLTLNPQPFRLRGAPKRRSGATAATGGLTFGPRLSTLVSRPTMNIFQIIFTPTSAAELARMPKELQLQILGEFRGLPQQALGTELDDFGKLELDGRTLHRFRVGDYRVYFERHELGVLVHRILSRHTLKDFLFRSGLKTGEDEALQENPKFWELIESAKTSAKA